MSILIKGMEKPKSCYNHCFEAFIATKEIGCPLKDYEESHQYKDRTHPDCPLIEIADTEWEWCHDCKEYDQEAHCCHRWTKVIRKTIAELEECYGERRSDER